MDQSQLNALYQQYLGRDADPSGLATWSNMDPSQVVSGLTGSQEYQSAHGGAGASSPADGNAQDLANQVFNLYATNQNYDKQLNQLSDMASTDPSAYYNARIGLLGKQMGWQTGQNTGDRNSVYQNELNSLIPGAKAAGMTDEQINNLIGTNSASASQQNQNRIAQDAASGAGKGWVNQNVPGGYATLGALAAAVAAPYLAPELFAATATGEGAAAIGGGEALGGGAVLEGGTAATLPSTSWVAPEIGGTMGSGSTFGSITAPLTGSGAVPGAGALTTGAIGEGALTGALPAGVVVGDGTAGTVMGATYMATPAGTLALDASGAAIPASSVGIGGFAPAAGGASILDTLSSLNKVRSGLNLGKTVLGALTGGAAAKRAVTGSTAGDNGTSSDTNTSDPVLKGDVLQGNSNYNLIERPASPTTKAYREGGEVEHNPEFFSEGGLNSLKNTYVKGEGDGTSDSVPAMLANGEFVIPADVVASLGNGSNDSGSKVLSEFLETIRAHKQKHGAKKLPPDSKGPLAYLTDAKRKSKV